MEWNREQARRPVAGDRFANVPLVVGDLTWKIDLEMKKEDPAGGFLPAAESGHDAAGKGGWF
jgi:hypothetical protein